MGFDVTMLSLPDVVVAGCGYCLRRVVIEDMVIIECFLLKLAALRKLLRLNFADPRDAFRLGGGKAGTTYRRAQRPVWCPALLRPSVGILLATAEAKLWPPGLSFPTAVNAMVPV